MMDGPLLRLYPPPCAGHAIEGLYLAHDLRGRGDPQRPYVYSNFITSLDGRISLPDPVTGLRGVPAAMANPHDWRLYLELAAQADVLLATGPLLRALAAGRRRGLLALTMHPDLVSWRRERMLPPLPALAALTARLDVSVEALKEIYPAPVILFAGAALSAPKREELTRQGAEIEESAGLDGRRIVHALHRRGYRMIYSIGGPLLLHALVAADQLQRLYLTLVPLILGGALFDTLSSGPVVAPPGRFHLSALHLDHATNHQLFAVFDHTA